VSAVRERGGGAVVSDDLGERLTDLEARVDALNRARTYL
jgi:hypothetical protein